MIGGGTAVVFAQADTWDAIYLFANPCTVAYNIGNYGEMTDIAKTSTTEVRMPWEVFNRDKVPTGDPSLTITKMGRISLNKNAAMTLQNMGAEYADVLWDRELSKIAVRMSEKSKTSFKLSYGENSNGVGFSATTFLNFIGYDWSESRNFPASFDPEDKMYIVNIPSEHIGKVFATANLTRSGTLQRADRVKQKPEAMIDAPTEGKSD